MPTKAKGVAKRSIHRSGLCFVESEIEFGIQFRIIGKVINSWRHQIIKHRFYTSYSFYYAGGTKAVAGHTFGTAYIQVVGMIAKYILYCFHFGAIAQRCAGAVCINVINV